MQFLFIRFYKQKQNINVSSETDMKFLSECQRKEESGAGKKKAKTRSVTFFAETKN